MLFVVIFLLLDYFKLLCNLMVVVLVFLFNFRFVGFLLIILKFVLLLNNGCIVGSMYCVL